MSINIFEYSVICPECRTRTVMLVEESELTLFSCNTCGSHFMLKGNRIYKIRDSFLKYIVDNYNTEECGSILFTRKTHKTEEYITDEKIEGLKTALDNSFFVEDFLKHL